jgi:carboxynorspermidine decarboxylase
MSYTLNTVPTPCYVLQEEKFVKNLEILKYVIDKTGAKILLAQKAFSSYVLYPLISKYISGTTASGLFEAKLGHEEMGNREVHVYCPAYKQEEMDEIVEICDHISFNSFNQWNKYKAQVLEKGISCSLRVNPDYSEIETDIYNPCIVGSRLGIPYKQLENADLSGLEGLHFHTMCEQGADVLQRTLAKIEENCGKYIHGMKWVNLGGGHHITRDDYDVELLIDCINKFKAKYNVQVYLEPGEAIALNAGVLVSEIQDIVENGMHIAIADTSAACHMPDVIEMPYRPNIVGSGEANEYEHTYRIGGPTCLAGDIIGDYSFKKPLEIGDRIVFEDMAIYSIVKNNTFNGMPLPSIAVEKDGKVEVVKSFGYKDFKERL